MAARIKRLFQSLSLGDKIESEYPFFLLYLRSITSGAVSRLALLQMASKKAVYKHIAPYFKKILNLVSEWRYSQASACNALSREVPSRNLGGFLYRMSQSIKSGEPVSQFVEREYLQFSSQYYEKRMRAIERLKSLSDTYLPINSVTIFLCVTILLSSIFFSPKTMILLAILSVVGISGALFALSWRIYKAARPDGVMIEEENPKLNSMRRLILLAALASGITLVATPLITPFKDYFYPITLAGAPLLLVGYLGKRYIRDVKKCEEQYPAFLRHIGSNCAVEIPILTVLKSACETDFGVLNRAVKRLYAKLLMRLEPEVAWWSFEIELGSRLIQRVNTILTEVLYTGGDVTSTSKLLGDFYFTYTTLRRRRYQVVSYLVGMLIPLHMAMAGLFAVIDGFFSALADFMSEISVFISFLSPPPVSFFKFFFLFTLVLMAFNNSIAVYAMEGDSRFTLLFYLGLLLTAGGAIYLVTSTLTFNYLSSIVTA
ncbi:type II secretion system F family protein [Candidatus Bathyarchaeota archaeon]|nr:type II secretion system F family protein [Candidatus Bathyarchaeota archaeon]